MYVSKGNQRSGNGVTEMMFENFKLAFLLGLVTMLAACESRTSGSLGYVEPDTPDAQPCGEGCPKVKRVYPILMRMGSLSLSVLRTPSRIVRRAAPMMTASMIASLISCLLVWLVRMGAALCATPCVADDECPLAGIVSYSAMEQAHVYRILAAVVLQRATERGAITECSISNAEGSCSGERSCGPDGLSECSAQIQTEELCDGFDNNCDGGSMILFPSLA